MSAAALDIGDPAGEVPLTGEGGQIGADGLCTLEPCGRNPVAIIGGTGYVGRLLARRLLSHPTLCLGPIVGSKRSEGMVYQDVWEEKESALMKNYGSQLWSAMPFPPQLAGVKVASLEALLASDCKIAVSCVAPDVGYIEDILVNGGVSVYSISPYKRSENLTVPEVNPAQIPVAVDKALFKSPNCVSVGTTLALKAVDDAFGLAKVSVCTFQSLSGRGDAMYPPELVQGNIYPVWNTKERTEVYIGNEICALVNLANNNLTVRAHRVGVHIGHFVDVRCKVRCPELLTSVDAVHKAFEAFAPLAELYGPEMPSLPERPLKVIKEVGAPRPATHNMEFGGMQVAVGNVKLDDGVWDCCFSLVVNNMIRGAYGAALLMAEYHTYCQRHPDVAARILARHKPLDPSRPLSTADVGPASPASVLSSAVALPAAVPAAKSNDMLSASAVAKARSECDDDAGAYHGGIAERMLHWFHPGARAWFTRTERGWEGWGEDGKDCSLEDPSWSPWKTALDDGKAPYFEWFVGARTSAAFNEVDRHVLAGHGDETAFIAVGPAAFEAGLADQDMLTECMTLSRKHLLTSSAVASAVLKEAGITAGDRIVILLPHCLDAMIWIEAAKRIGAIYTCLPESISVASLAGRVFDLGAKLVITSYAKSSVAATSHKAMASTAVMDYVSMEAVLRALKRVLPEQRWRSQQGKVDIRAIADAVESSFKGDGAVSPKEVATKLEVIFSMQAPLRDKAETLANHLQSEMIREHAGRVKTRLLVLPTPLMRPPSEKSAEVTAPAGAPTASETAATAAAPTADEATRTPESERRMLSGVERALHRPRTAKKSSPPGMRKSFATDGHSSETAAQLGSLVLFADEMQAKIMPAFLTAAGVESYAALLEMDGADLVARVWAAAPCVPLPSMHPKSVVYTSGSSGYKSTGLVQDIGGYCAGVTHTMVTCFDATPGVDIIFADAAPSWVTGQTYGVTGPLCRRVTSVLCSGMPEHMMAQCLANVVHQLKVTIFVASASFLKRALKNTWTAAWLQRQALHKQLRVAASCGEPLSPAMHRLGMATLTPNYINSYWASEHGAIILGSSTYGNADQRVAGDSAMYALPWVNAAVWLPFGDALEDGRTRFTQADAAQGQVENKASTLAVVTGEMSKLKGRLVVTRPWPAMARTVWGDAELAGSSGWVGDLDLYRARYWSTFARDDGEPMMALDLADLACPWADGSFSVLGHSREELRVGPEGVVIAAAELEATILAASSDVIDCIVIALPDPDGKKWSYHSASTSLPIACLVLPEDKEIDEVLTNLLKRASHEALGPNCVPYDFVHIPAIPRTHNAKPMRNVVQRLFLAEKTLTDVSEIANPSCLLELKAAVDEWRFQQAAPTIDERC